ncbi:unnamed protein product [Debaryomyces tyrocola]|nr:unnamed protein product [Debaryomyces tyrocola]
MQKTNYKLDTDALVPEINDSMKKGLDFEDEASAVSKTPRTKNKEIEEKADKSENETQGARRRKHKNSKNGCPNCKKRRVKCSETLPACSNCVRRKVRCGYLDYTEAQLKDLRQSKFVIEKVDNYSGDQDKGEGESRDSSLRSSEIQQPSPSSLNALKTSNPFPMVHGRVSDHISDNAYNYGFRWEDQYAGGYDMGVNNVLNFQGNLTSTEGDNLVSSSEYPVIYPVYSIKNSNPRGSSIPGEPDLNNTNPSFRPSRDVFNSGAFSSNKLPVLWNDSIISPRTTDYFDTSGSLIHSHEKALPGAIEKPTNLKRIYMPNINYNQLIHELMLKFGPQLATGTCSLKDNIYLYSVWLHSFIHYSFTQKLMFGCMINFTTNYLISNCWMPQYISGGFTALIDRTKVRNLLISSSIRHYAMAIKELRVYLNKDTDPLVCSSASFVLSLTSIYDPSATLRSMNCFRDGLFSILQHNVAYVTQNGQPLPFMLMMHLEVLKNIVRSVYLPAYDPTFLYEYRSMLRSFGNFLSVLSNSSTDAALDTNDIDTQKFIEAKFSDLIVFTNETIDTFLPTINNNLGNLEIQQQSLFDMLHKWVRIFPAKCMFISNENDPVENILYFFYKCLKKALYAVFPQVKYFFVREFDSPVTVDISVPEEDFEIYLKGLENPESCCYSLQSYNQVKDQLKFLGSYSIRVNIFLQKRLEILNRTVIFDWSVKEAFPIDDIKCFRNSITDIAKIRNDFKLSVQLHESPISSFATTFIKPEHYPRRFEYGINEMNNNHSKEEVDLLTLTNNGLLANDYEAQ